MVVSKSTKAPGVPVKISATSEESNEATEGNWEIFCARKTELSNEERLRQESLHLTWNNGWMDGQLSKAFASNIGEKYVY